MYYKKLVYRLTLFISVLLSIIAISFIFGIPNVYFIDFIVYYAIFFAVIIVICFYTLRVFLKIYFDHDWSALINTTIVLSSVIFCLVVVELGLRAIDYSDDNALLIYQPPSDDYDTFSLKRNLNIVTRFDSRDVVIKTNAHGMRWREVALNNPRRMERIAFVGDSFTFGLWADSIEQAFVGVFDQAFRSDGVETLNFGVPGYGLADEIVQIEKLVLLFGPRYIILTIYAGNDFLDTYLGRERYHVSESGLLTLDQTIVEKNIPAEFRRADTTKRRGFLSRIYLYRLIRNSVDALLPTFGEFIRARRRADTAGRAHSLYSSNMIWSGIAYPGFAQAARQSTYDALSSIKRMCDENGVGLLIVVIPSIEQVISSELFETDFDIRLPQKYLMDFSSRKSIAYLDLWPTLTDFYEETGESPYHLSDGHLNNQGHLIVGESVIKFFSDRR